MEIEKQEKKVGFYAINDVNIKLVGIWEDFSRECHKIFAQFSSFSPSSSWNNPDIDSCYSSEFNELAELLEEAREDSQSLGARFVSEIRKLIILTRAKISKIIYS